MSTVVLPAGQSEGGECPSLGFGIDFQALIRGIRAGDASFVRQLDALLSPGVLFLLARELPAADVPAKVHGVILAVVRRVKDGNLEDPDSLLAFVRNTTREHISNYRNSRMDQAPVEGGPPPSGSVRTLETVPERNREALNRFYVLGQTEEQILEDMRLTQQEFRLLKSEARATFSGARLRKPVRSEGSRAGDRQTRVRA